MTREDIIRMALEAGVEFYPSPTINVRLCSLDNLERFAALVAAAEAEKWAKGAKISVPTETMEQQFSVYHRRGYEAGKALIPAAVAAEREACAKVCEETTASWTEHTYNSACIDCAVAIRARGGE